MQYLKLRLIWSRGLSSVCPSMRVILRYKFLLLSSLLVFGFFFGALAVFINKGDELEKAFARNGEKVLQDRLEAMVWDTYELCQSAQGWCQNELERVFSVFEGVCNQRALASTDWRDHFGRVTQFVGCYSDRQQAWQPVNQFDSLHRLEPMTLPCLTIGKSTFGQESLNSIFGLLDFTQEVCVGVFQRISIAGDMLNIATTLKDFGGRERVDTYVPAQYPTGDSNSVIHSILNGNSTFGRYLIFGTWYVGSYKPVVGNQGDVLGMVFVGIKNRCLAPLSESLNRMRAVLKGNIWVLSGGLRNYGANVAEVAFMQQDEPWHKSTFDRPDKWGTYFMRELCQKAIAANKGSVMEMQVNLAPYEKLLKRRLFYTYFEPWDWVIALEVDDAIFSKNKNEILGVFYKFVRRIFLLLAGLSFGLLFISFLITWRLLQRIQSIKRLSHLLGFASFEEIRGCFQLMTEKDLASRMRLWSTSDELLDIFTSFGVLVGRLENMKDSGETLKKITALGGEQLQRCCVEQKAVSKQLQSSVHGLIRALKDLSVSVKQVIQGSSSLGQEFAAAAHRGPQKSVSMVDIQKILSPLRQATSAVASRMSVISEKANKMSKVITTVSKIADQTHLVALNISIHSSKVPHAHSGLGIVAEGMTTLADKIAAATLDSEQVINEMQLAANFGIKEMDRFVHEAYRSFEEIEKAFADQIAMNVSFENTKKGYLELINSLTLNSERISAMVTDSMALFRMTTQATGMVEDFNQVGYQIEASRLVLARGDLMEGQDL